MLSFAKIVFWLMMISALAVHIKLQNFLHDAFQRNMALGRDSAAILIFRSIIRDCAIHAGNLHPYIAPSGRYRHPFSRQRLTPLFALPHS
jgi:hypothetical protein